MLTTQFILTVVIFTTALAIIARMVILERRPRDNLNPRLLPTTPIIIAGGFVALLALVHLINLAGVHTGR